MAFRKNSTKGKRGGRGGNSRGRGGSRGGRGGGTRGGGTSRHTFNQGQGTNTAVTIGPQLPLDTTYSAAGILPYRVEGGRLYVMVAIMKRKDTSDGSNGKPQEFVCLLGGPPRTDPGAVDANFIVTAVRQLHVKSANALPTQSINGMMKVLSENQTAEMAAMYWAQGNYVLLVYPWKHDLQFVEQFNSQRSNLVGQPNINKKKVAISLQWVPAADLYSGGNSITIGGRGIRVLSLLGSILSSAPQLRSYLEQLQGSAMPSAPAMGSSFGTPPSSPFGAPAASVFGASSSPSSLFGGAPASPGLFGSAGGVPPFGSPVTPTAPAFGSPGTSGLFGSPATVAGGATNENFQDIANTFAQHYFQAFNANKSALQAFFTSDSMFTLSGQKVGGADIMSRLQSLNMQLTVQKVEAQPVPSSRGVMIMVLGRINTSGTHFTQVFHLIPSATSFVVHNTILKDIA